VAYARAMSGGESDELVPGVPTGLELGLRNYWYTVAPSGLVEAKPLAVAALGEDLVAWRSESGTPHVFADVCPHRAARLSLGAPVGDDLQCAFHGLRFDGEGRCTHVPWEPAGSLVKDEVRAAAYPTAEVGGLVFAYLGDTARFPAPAPRDELPAELWDDDCTGFVLTEVWDANWLNATDGSDLFHVPFLHAASAMPPESRSGASREMSVTKTRTKFGLDMHVTDDQGRELFTGQVAEPDFVDEGFFLPGLLGISIQPAASIEPFHVYLWMFPIEAERTQVTRWVCRRTPTEADREEWRRYWLEQGGRERILAISAEDRRVAESLRSLQFARAHEHLLAPDAEVYRRRVQLRDAFLAQRQGRRLIVPPNSARAGAARAALSGAGELR
jgi:phenylpropionate dioxygenase-like ring-hydroxylating dioxygenase large terminal subunit